MAEVHLKLEFSEVNENGNFTTGKQYVDVFCDESEIEDRIQEERNDLEGDRVWEDAEGRRKALPELAYVDCQRVFDI